MRILLTGSGGAMATQVAHRLGETHEIVQLGGEMYPGVAVAEGDLSDPRSVRAGMEGCEIAIHDAVGAVEALGPGTPSTLGAELVAQTSGLLAAARSTGVGRVVVLSAALASASGDPGGKSRTPISVEELRPWPRLYALRRAEDLALREGGDRSVLLCHAPLLAPGLRQGALGNHIVALLRGGPASASASRLCLADARDVAAGVESALRRGQTGHRYLLGSRPFTLHTFDDAVLRLAALLHPLPWAFAQPAPDSAGDPAPGLPGCVLDVRDAARDLGWWTRRPGQTLRDTLVALAEVARQGRL